MSYEIGETAGAVWRYLNEFGATSIGKLSKEIEVDKKLVQRAIGWLAKEDKIEISVSDDDKDIISLK